MNSKLAGTTVFKSLFVRVLALNYHTGFFSEPALPQEDGHSHGCTRKFTFYLYILKNGIDR